MDRTTEANLAYYSDPSRLDFYDSEESKYFYDPNYISHVRRLAGQLVGTFPKKPIRALDIAAGTGFVGREILKPDMGIELTGVDISKACLERAARSGVYRDLREGNATALPFESGTYDLAIIHSALHHIEDYPAVIRECSRVLRPGGLFWIACESCVGMTRLYVALGNILNRVRPKPHINAEWKQVEHHIFEHGGFQPAKLKASFRAAGLEMFIEEYNNLEFIFAVETNAKIRLTPLLPRFLRYPRFAFLANKFDYVGRKI